jgi:hypothetical protein
MSEAQVKRLLAAHHLLRQLECAWAIAADGPLDRERLPGGVASLLIRAGGAADLPELEQAVEHATSTVRSVLETVVG